MSTAMLAATATIVVATLSSAVQEIPPGGYRPAPTVTNVLFIVVDNLRPALGAYGVPQTVTPNIDSLAKNSTLFSRAFCQESWCSPSRNSFLSGRRPAETKAWNFRDSFRQNADGTPAAGADWVTLPQYFKEHGYYCTSSGKVFHPDLPANFDFPKSWSDQPLMQNKSECQLTNKKGSNMACAFDGEDPGDNATATDLIARLFAWQQNKNLSQVPFFAAAGFQGPRLAWSYPSSVLNRLPKVADMQVAKHTESSISSGHYDWFRPVEIAWYEDVIDQGGVSHDKPLSYEFQQKVRLAYYAAITHVDDQVGRLLQTIQTLGVEDNTLVVFTADHAQNLGEGNMWSMMSLQETALRVPLLIRPAPRDIRKFQPVYSHPVELVDLYPTMVSLAGLPTPPGSFNLPGDDLSPGMIDGQPVKRVDAAFGEITRCKNCSEAYATAGGYRDGCTRDSQDAANWLVPCAKTDRSEFDFMGMTVRQSMWRYSVFCKWNGNTLSPDFSSCQSHELFAHANDTSLYNVDDNGEQLNLAGLPKYAQIQADLHKLILNTYDRP